MAYGGWPSNSSDSSDEKAWSWKTFLGALPKTPKGGSNVIHWDPIDRSRLCDDLFIVKFIQLLQEQNDETIKKNEKAEDQARDQVDDIVWDLAERITCTTGYHNKQHLVEIIFSKLDQFQKVSKAQKKKSHLEMTGSCWDTAMLARYVQRKDIEFTSRSPPSPSEMLTRLTSTIHQNLTMSLKAIGYELNTESDTRMLLDTILQPLCVEKCLHIRTEETLQCPSLPTSRYDYIIYKQNNPIGVVEAKRMGFLIEKSVVQLILQLILVSAEKPSARYFGVLCDGCRFIFVGVCGGKLTFFQEDDWKLESKSLWLEDHQKDPTSFQLTLQSIVCSLSWHIDEAILEHKLHRQFANISI